MMLSRRVFFRTAAMASVGLASELSGAVEESHQTYVPLVVNRGTRIPGVLDPSIIPDGVTDNTAAVQALVDATPDGGLVDLTTTGVIKCVGEIHITKSLTIMQRGGAMSKYANLFVVGGGPDVDIVVDGIYCVDIARARIVCLKSGNTVGNLTVRNCRSEGGGVLIQGTVTDWLRIQNNEIGLSGVKHFSINVSPVVAPDYVNKLLIAGNFVQGNVSTGEGLLDLGGVVDTAQVANNRLINCGGDGCDFDSGSRRMVMTGNVIENCRCGAEIKPGGHNSEDVIFANNMILNCEIGFCAQVPGIYQGNTVLNDVGTNDTAIYTEGPGLHFIGNYVKVGENTGLLLKGDDCLVMGNRIICGNMAVYIIDGNRDRIIGNYLESVTDKGRVVYPSVGEGHLVSGNTIVGGEMPWDASRDRKVIFRDNTILGYKVPPVGGYSQFVGELDATKSSPTIQGGTSTDVWTWSGEAPKSLHDFSGGLEGQTIAVLFVGAHATLIHGTKLMLFGSLDYSVPAKTMMRFQQIGGVWYELSRSEV